MRTTPAGRLVVRAAAAEDAPEALALHQAVLDEDHWFITSGDEFHATTAWMSHRIGDFSRRENSLFLLALLDRRLVGLLTIDGGRLRRLWHVGRLEIMVAQDARGAGVGQALMEIAVEWAQACPALGKLSLAVFADNVRAAELYRRMGFVDEGRRIGEYREADGSARDDLLMALTV